ncbi:MAG: EamA family transporter [Pseudomonadota bacterium]
MRADVGVTGLVRTVLDPFLLTALAIYGVATIVWVYALRHIPLSQAYPVMAFSFNLVPLASFAFLGETLGLRYWIGAGMIVMNT